MKSQNIFGAFLNIAKPSKNYKVKVESELIVRIENDEGSMVIRKKQDKMAVLNMQVGDQATVNHTFKLDGPAEEHEDWIKK